MAYVDMYSELRGSVKKLPLPLSKKLINRAWEDLRGKNLWSFQCYEQNWVSPALITVGRANVTFGSPSVTLDATANAAVLASNTASTLVTARQFRTGTSTIYYIVAYDDGTGVITLDRNYTDVTNVATPYQIFQCYYPAPYLDHKSFVDVVDRVTPCNLDLTSTLDWVNNADPWRLNFYTPTKVISIGRNPISSHIYYKYPMFLLWGVPYTQRPYQLFGIRNGLDLSARNDELPWPITEEVVVELAKVAAYEWAEANKEAEGQGGPDFKFLMGKAQTKYNELMADVRKQDRELIDNFFRSRNRNLYGRFAASYSSISQTANPGGSVWG